LLFLSGFGLRDQKYSGSCIDKKGGKKALKL